MFKPHPENLLIYNPETSEYVRPPLFFIDVETSGLEPHEGAVMLEFGGVVDVYAEQDSSTPVLTSELSMSILPTKEEWEKASPKALELNGFTYEELEEKGVSKEEAFGRFCSWVAIIRNMVGYKIFDNARFVGQNPKFDIKFLKELVPVETLLFLGFPHTPHVDVIDNILLFKNLERLIPSIGTGKYNTHALSKALGVEEEDKMHRALGGAHAARRNYYAIQDRVSSFIKDLKTKALQTPEDKNVMLCPIDDVYSATEFMHKLDVLGWTYSGKPGEFVDKEGTRWGFIGGAPPAILYKLSMY